MIHPLSHLVVGTVFFVFKVLACKLFSGGLDLRSVSLFSRKFGLKMLLLFHSCCFIK